MDATALTSQALEILDPTLDLPEAIDRLRVERKAVILAHYYQDP